jgi:hypothetical protein
MELILTLVCHVAGSVIVWATGFVHEATEMFGTNIYNNCVQYNIVFSKMCKDFPV